MKRVAVIGIAGFCGRHFEKFVVDAGLAGSFKFFGFARDARKAAHSGSFAYGEGDALAPGALELFITEVRPNYILNLIGLLRAEHFVDLAAINVGVSRAICEAVVRAKWPVEKIVLIGSAAEYGVPVANPVAEDAPLRPINPYGLTKVYQTLLADFFFRNCGVPTVVARTFNALGEGLTPLLSAGSFMQQIAAALDGGVIKVGNISTIRDFLPVAEVSRRYWKLVLNGVPGEIYNVCSGIPIVMRSVIDELIRESGKQLSIEIDPSRFKDRDVVSIYGDQRKYERVG